MFCSKCGNQLNDSDRFCEKCGAAVLKQYEPQVNPAAEPVYLQSPASGVMETQPVNYPAAASVQKKSKKMLIIGLSLGGVLLAVILAVGLIFVFGLKGGSKGNDGSINLGYSTVVYDDQYTYFLSETETWAPCIKRVRNDLSGQPEILYEAEEIEGDGWSMYPMHCMFLWNDKICFIEYTNYTEQGDEEFEIHWLSKDGKENGTLISYEDFIGYARSLYRDDFQPLMEEVYFFGDYLIFSDRYSFCQLNLNTGGMFEYDTLLSIQGPACFVAYNDGYYYYFVPDTENNRMGETLYRMYSDIEEGVLGEAEEIGKVPLRDDEDVLDFWEKYYPFIPKGDYLYYADSENIYRLSINDGEIEKLTSYDDSTYNRFALCENGLYYYKDMTLHFLNTETLEETIFDEVEGIPNFIHAGANDACWMQGDATSERYNCFLPDKQGGSLIYFGESDQDASAEDSVEDQDTVNTTALYADVVENFIGRYGNLSFGESDNEFYAQGVFKIDLKDFNQDGTDELMILYTVEENGIYPYIEIFTVEDGGLVELFSQKTRDEFHEAAMSFCLYQNGGNLYVPVYDSLDQNPVYVHLYGFNENREFGEVYQYENNAFYMNQLPDGMEFTKCEETQFYTNTQFAYYDDFENIKEEMRESLQIDMVNMLNELGIAVPENSSTQTNQSEFDITSMLGEWTLELILPDGSTVRRVIKLQADGTMTMRAEDGSWQDYTYVMDDTHFAYTYVGTGISSGGTYTISGDVITVYLEAEN
ncbi:zinc-ribbon domain-containing protein [Anaeromassilibacillus senegalensis]|uniref:Zinc-ribbon domain-containing protein n=1 Tax=Anaeromassilibacillus senegalensis TaxID=1673717 RepID=A0ABS9CP23_9FIRM|nr:zinc-ribbon domain-containing protein [Anaeromassilibacillus senegalensis]